MRITHHHSAATFVGFVVMMTLGCDGSNGPTTGPTTGAIDITVSTEGASIDLDPDGYSVSVGGGAPRTVGVNAVVTIGGLAPGRHLVVLYGLAPNCSVIGTNPVAPNQQTVVVGREGVASVAFEVRCTPSSKLAFTYLSGLYVSQIYTVSVNGGISSPLTALPGSAFTPAWSPDGSRIAFATDDANLEIYQNLEIYVMNRDGSNPVRLTSAVGQDTQPAWSPDGAKIAFASNRTGKSGIYIMNADGTDPVQLSSESSGSAFDPTWSPDGTRIGFASNGEIRVMNADGSGQSSLTTGRSDRAPEWSPDGTRIAFSREASGSEAIFIMNADGSNVTRLTSDFESAKDATWSPDGSKIAFAGLLPDNDYWSPVPVVSIFVVGIDGTKHQSPTALRASSPAWSRR